MGVGSASNDVHNVPVACDDARQGANHALESLVGGKQAEGKQHKLLFDGELLLVDLRLHKRQVGDAMRNQVDLFVWNSKYALQNAGRVLAHHNKAIRLPGNFLHDPALAGVWFAKYSMQSCHDRHVEVLKQMHDITAGMAPIDSILMLQTH